MLTTDVTMQLDLTRFNSRLWDLDIETCSAAGFRFATMSSLGDNYATRQQLFAFITRARGLTIDREVTTLDFWTFILQHIDVPSYDPRGVSIVLRGSQWIAVSQVSDARESGDMFDEGTWVAPAFRRRGLATSMKAMSMQFVKDRGIDSVRTIVLRNDIASLELYRSLGFH
ncbi:MAG: GCN5-related N-acetyltransferase [Frondihabitans sp.]|nr:GCN5-related N-acetyltransferase [Frondihabitans sp.]